MINLDPPVISLQLGSKLQPGDIKEGDDVYFECRIDANPKFRRLTWLHNVSIDSDFFTARRETLLKIHAG